MTPSLADVGEVGEHCGGLGWDGHTQDHAVGVDQYREIEEGTAGFLSLSQHHELVELHKILFDSPRHLSLRGALKRHSRLEQQLPPLVQLRPGGVGAKAACDGDRYGLRAQLSSFKVSTSVTLVWSPNGTGCTCRCVTPASAKAAIRSAT